MMKKLFLISVKVPVKFKQLAFHFPSAEKRGKFINDMEKRYGLEWITAEVEVPDTKKSRRKKRRSKS